MRLDDLRRSGNIEDRRGAGGLGGPIAIGGGGLGLVIAIVYVLMGGDPSDLMQQGQPAPAQQTAPGQPRPDDKLVDFSAAVLGSTEDVWTQVFKENGRQYTPTTFVPYDEATQTGCGTGQAAMGPFYCPADQKVYVDLSFFRELDQKFGAPGDFAQAYVIAHEVGHHVQHILGIDRQAGGANRASGATSGSVRLELQADCFAGVWAARANTANQMLEPGDVEEGLAAANAVGDDTLQRRSQGRVVPDAFTHGSSEQRMRWFQTGYRSGDINSCDTFSASRL
jgi:predicted metalloprotease